jgi:hypothetical protein
MRVRENPDKDAFPVTVCEAFVDPEDRAVTFADGSRVAWGGLDRVARVAVLGDTGCDPAEQQLCDVPQSWSFPEIATVAAGSVDGASGPELVVHVGDYRYRKRGLGGGDNWQNWLDDFFAPAERLLLAAPWVMVRGNHENCHKAHGAGWFFFLQPELGIVSHCADDADLDPDNSAPYAVDLPGYGDRPSMRLVVIDSANAKYRCKTWTRDFTELYEQRLRDLLRVNDRTKIWLLTHYPVWDVSLPYLSQDEGRNRLIRCENASGNAASTFSYQKFLGRIVQDHAGAVETVLSGDTHHFQVLRLHQSVPPLGKPGRSSVDPLQIVVGNSGASLDPALGPRQPDGLPQHSCGTPDKPTYFERRAIGRDGWIMGKAVCRYGYLIGTRGDSGWAFQLRVVGETGDAVQTICGPGVPGPACYERGRGDPCVLLGEEGDCGLSSDKAELP